MNGPWVDVTTVYIKKGCNSVKLANLWIVYLISRKNQLKEIYRQLTSFHFPIYEIYVGDFVVVDWKAGPFTLFFVAMQIIILIFYYVLINCQQTSFSVN